MKRWVAWFSVSLLLLVGCTQTVDEASELPVGSLTLSDLYNYPPKVMATVTGWTSRCGPLSVQQSFLNKTFRLTVLGSEEDSVDEACSALAQEYLQTVVLDEMYEPGIYTVLAGEERATFEIPESYRPETAKAYVEAVDVVVRETSPVHIVTYVTYDQGCDPEPFIEVSQRSEGAIFFLTVLQSTYPSALMTCPPTTYPEIEAVTLETTDLASGSYIADVNGVREPFSLP